MAHVVGAGADEIARAAGILRAGGLVAFPTETVYGLGASALDERAVARVFDVKGRPRFDPLIVHVPEIAAVRELTLSFPPAAQRLAERFWPGPLTLVLPKSPTVPDLVTAGTPTVAVRVPDHAVALALLQAARVPVAAPSANPFGGISPTTAEHVRDQLADAIDLILDGGPCRLGVESTVVQVTDSRPRILRLGGTTVEELEAVAGPVIVSNTIMPHQTIAGLNSPGTLAQHYAPRTPLKILGAEDELHSDATESESYDLPAGARVGLLALRAPLDPQRFQNREILSQRGDLREAAAKFFSALRRLDAAGLDLILAAPFPEEGLGRALNDRLRRAAHD